MALDRAFLQELFRRCESSPLLPSDPRHVPRELFGLPSLAEDIATKIELGEAHSTHWVSGVRGVGLTTELLRLADILRSQSGGRYLVVRVAAEEVLDLFEPVKVEDAVLVLLDATRRAVDGLSGATPTVSDRLWSWLRASGDGAVPVETAAGALPLSLRGDSAMKRKFRARATERATEFLQAVRDELELLRYRARSAGIRDFVLVLDHLTWLHGHLGNREEVALSIEALMRSWRAFVNLPAHVVLTCPMSCVFSPRLAFEPVELLLPCSPDEVGARRFLQQVLSKRITPLEMAALVEHPERVAEVVTRWSGGLPRDLVMLLRELVPAAFSRAPISEERIDGLVRRAGENFRRLAAGESDLIEHVARTGELPFLPNHERHRLDRLFDATLVLAYEGAQGTRFDVHPALRAALNLPPSPAAGRA